MTNKQRTWKTTVVDVQRLNNSRNGNPRYEIKTIDCFSLQNDYQKKMAEVCDNDEHFKKMIAQTWKTPANCGWVYGLSFHALEGKEVELKYHFTKTGRVVLDNITVI